MKRSLSLFLCIVLLLSLSVDKIAVRAVGTPTIICEDVICEAGEQITVAVTISNNPGFTYLEVSPTYSSELTLIKATNGELVSDFTKGKQYVWIADEDVVTDGLLMTFTFDIAETVSAGEYSVGFIVRTCGNYNEEPVQFSVENGTITVKAKPVPVAGVSLNKNELSLKTGEAESLVATVSPDKSTNKTVIWRSDDETIATVDSNGKVVAVKEGTTTITVTTEDGGFKATCVVSVACSHANKTETPESGADCVNTGNNKYYTCNACGDVFKADGVTETTVQAETIPALNHDFTEQLEDAAHQVPGSGANCQHAKVYYYDCSRCAVMGTTTWTSDTKGEHEMETTWTTKDNKHYHKCSVSGCTYTEDEANCSGGAATCTAKAICDTCLETYGEILDHDLTHYAPAAADHTKPGNIEYWQCEDCEKFFSDASANDEITQADTVIAQVPHSHSTSWSENDTQHWNECACGDKINVYDHNYDNTCDTTCNTCGYIRTITHTWMTTLSYNADQHWIECDICHEKKEVEDHHGGTATCQEKATCDDCGQVYGELLGCDFTAEKAEDKYLVSAATCKDAAVYNKSCTVCGKAGTIPFTTEKNPDNHVGGTEIRGASAESCTVDGYTGDTHCKGCDAQLEKGQVIPATAHKNATAVPEEESTCKTNGVKAHFHCPVCDKDYLEKTVAAVAQTADDLKLPLNPEKHEGGTEIKDVAPATCTVPGYTGDTYCKGCGVKIATGTTIPAEHKLDRVAANPATHEKAGNIEHYACSVCDELYNDDKATTELTEAEVVIPKGEHSYGETFKSDENGHWKDCECGDKTEEGAHAYGEWVTTKEPAAGAEGSKERTCTTCEHKETEKLPALSTPDTGDNMLLNALLMALMASLMGMCVVIFLLLQKDGKYQR